MSELCKNVLAFNIKKDWRSILLLLIALGIVIIRASDYMFVFAIALGLHTYCVERIIRLVNIVEELQNKK
jgi:hypothetical protein